MGRKLVIGAIVTLSCALLLFALGLATDRWWMVWGAVPCAIAAGLSLRRRTLPGCPPASAGELALAAATATYTIAAVTFAWFGFYWLVRGGAWLVAEPFGGDDGDVVAWIVTLLLFGPVVLVATARAAYEMEAELYPATGLRSRYRDVIRFRGRKLILRTIVAVAVLVAFAVIAIVANLEPESIGLWLLILFSVGGAAFAVPAGAQRLGSVRSPDVKRVADSAAAAGWQVLPNPQTGDAGIDPYLAEIDLFASKGALSVLMKVVQGDPGAVAEGKLNPVGWPVVATVLTAARSLPADQLPDSVRTVEPVIVLIDAELESEPLVFAAQNGVALLSIDAATTFARAPEVPRLEEELTTIGDAVRKARVAKREVAA